MPNFSQPKDALKKLLIVEGLYQLAYAAKSAELRRKYPEYSPVQVHEEVLRLIDKGCR